ncbi:MAG TPA: DnaJ domain-containing protein, partial [Holophaga sp.]|nr:DnaJ domain-containing protein [Holophaga sp.]
MNPYEVLEISPGSRPEEIKAAYHRLAKQWHPDRFNGAAKAEAEGRFRQLAEAFNMLKDTARREEPP